MLKEPAFQSYFTVCVSDAASDYKKANDSMLMILYAIFQEKQKSQQDKKSNFFEFVRRFLSKSDVSDRIQVGLETSLKFSLSLLREVSSINKDLLVNSLEYLYQSVR